MCDPQNEHVDPQRDHTHNILHVAIEEELEEEKEQTEV